MASILVSCDAGVLSVTLNRPDKLNAFNPEMHKLLRDALEQALDDASIRAVLLTGAGRAFCAGADLRGGSGPGASSGPADVFATEEREAHSACGADEARKKVSAARIGNKA